MAKYDKNNERRCSFCGKPQSQVKKLINGNGLYICDECVQLCNEILKEDQSKRSSDNIKKLDARQGKSRQKTAAEASTQRGKNDIIRP